MTTERNQSTQMRSASVQSLPKATSPKQTSEPYSIFDKRQKALIIAIASVAATFSGFASNIYFPAIPNIAHDLSVSTELINLTVTSYLIFQAFAPSLWGPISDVKGRRTAYLGTFIVFLGACIGLALTSTYATLLVLRCLQSTGSASTIAIGSGVIGDVTTRAERGGFMGFFQAGLLVPVAIGPVIGGLLADSLGWKSVFWFLAIYGGSFVLFLILLFPETLRSVVANGSRLPSGRNSFLLGFPLEYYQKTTKTPYSSETSTPAARQRIDLTTPFRILVDKRAMALLFFLAIHYAVWQMSITAMATLFASTYSLSERKIGLTFLANGAGCIIGTILTGKILDADYRRAQGKTHATPTSEPRSIQSVDLEQEAAARQPASQPDSCAVDETNSVHHGPQNPSHEQSQSQQQLKRARLRLLPLFSLAQTISIIIFGWTVHYAVHIAVPIAATFVTGWTAIAAQSAIMVYFVDVFSEPQAEPSGVGKGKPSGSAAASASLNLARCLVAAGGTSVVGPMIKGLGVGWAFVVCGGAQMVALGVVLVWLLWNGREWRAWRWEKTKAGGGIVD
ncbi:uncharacterized protein HMPREF1541_11127 [Cyphellophora europaea CBS 101466]|uniref:Major facilitator superfamily (MFS) profile domain-containing protein n=1 Tax=Cyphellophora europaea (strain CBS 101466) TaxID=1220924 RepID=W2S6Y0_CYPE1|nr:uncharacterized protein HMPREF1541_11127 [Cyphellophora europaea CBS 101466]ETN43803.1 hypothetical protein HMPREF1541_11127 [Cyphellophora europaea CBS 101466]